MIICHSVYYNKSFYLWAEHSFLLKKIAKHKDKKHPFQGDGAGFAKIMKGLQIDQNYPNPIISLTLPTTHNPSLLPLPSSKILCEDDLEDVNVSLESWDIQTFNPSLRGLMRLFRDHGSKRMISPGVFIGPDVYFWGQVYALSMVLVKNQQVIPSVIKEEHNQTPIFRGVWRAVFDYQSEEMIQHLVKTMPMACIGGSDESPEDTLKEAIHAFVDFNVRQSLKPKQLLPHITKANTSNPHDAWLLSLSMQDNQIMGEPKAQQQLLEDVSLWQSRSFKNVLSGCRVCLEIKAPQIKEDADFALPNLDQDLWAITLSLQSTADPSLRVPLKDVWENPNYYKLLHTKEESALREFILKSLSHLSDCAPSLSPFLESLQSIPEIFSVPLSVAFNFLNKEASSLMNGGFGVFLPSWWKGSKKSALTAKARAKSSMQAQGQISLESMVHFEWEVALLDKTIREAELNTLAELKTPLIQVRGEWVMLSPEDIRKALKVYQEPQRNMNVQEFLKVSLTGSHDQLPGIPTEVAATGYLEDLRSTLTSKTYQEVQVDPQFKGELRPYQKAGMNWLANLKNWGMGACLADDMGLGKTVQTLAFIQKDFNNHKGKTLLICPTSVIGNWEKEAIKFTPNLRIGTYHGATRNRGEAFKEFIQNHDVILTSYTLLQKDIEDLKTIPWHGVILDEAQNIKNAATKQFKAVRSLQPFYRIALTGTPVENNVGDIWALMDFLNPGLLGTQTKFKNTFFTPIQLNRDPDTILKLKSLTSPFILRRLKTDKTIIKDLPDKIETKVYSYLTKEQASLYKAVTNEALKAIEEADKDSINRKGLILGMLTTLKQICNHPAHFLKDKSEIAMRSGKLERLTEMVEEIIQLKEKILIFTQFTEMGHLLKNHLQEQFGEEVLFLHGAVQKNVRDKMVEGFQSNEANTPSIFILSLKAGGTGLTLTAANHVFHFDRWWNPAVEDQASDRAFRIGQTKTVQVHKFVCRGTLEEKIDELLENKKILAQSVVESGEGWIGQLSSDALRDMVTLRDSALLN